MEDNIQNQFNTESGVGKCWSSPIEIRFKALIQSHCEKPFDWYKELGIDKADASRIRRGLIIPPEWMRIRIAGYFNTDSSTIWKIPEIISADKLKEELNPREQSLGDAFNSKKINNREEK